jgi:hypothetical protein
MKLPVKIPDAVIVFIATGITIFSAYAAYIKPEKPASVLIRANGREWIYQIDAEETVKINGPLGDTIIRIRDNHAWVESSPCENQNCMAAGFIARQGQWAACLPNNVLIMILGNRDEGVDAVVW